MVGYTGANNDSDSLNGDELEKELFNKAIELLSRREHSQTELTQKLRKRFECTQTQVDTALARVVDLGYQSDERFATAFIRSRLARGLGARRVEQEAKQKGLSEAMIQQVLDEETEEFSSQTMIEQVWRKKFKALPADQKERAKQYRFLQYRGFGGDDISRLYDRLKQDSER